jgi:hypothetical protein
MHGVYWATMGDISSQMGYTVPASDATPVWDTLATGAFRDKAVIVYPQATSPGGDLNKRTFWSLPFWRCSVGNCVDEGVDDIGYIERVLDLASRRTSIDRTKIYMTGTSAGGMMLHNLLCSSSYVSSKIAAAVDIIGGAGAPVKSTCHPAAGKRRVPLRLLHGEADSVLPYDRSADVDGAPFMSTSERLIFFLLSCWVGGTEEAKGGMLAHKPSNSILTMSALTTKQQNKNKTKQQRRPPRCGRASTAAPPTPTRRSGPTPRRRARRCARSAAAAPLRAPTASGPSCTCAACAASATTSTRRSGGTPLAPRGTFCRRSTDVSRGM